MQPHETFQMATNSFRLFKRKGAHRQRLDNPIPFSLMRTVYEAIHSPCRRVCSHGMFAE